MAWRAQYQPLSPGHHLIFYRGKLPPSNPRIRVPAGIPPSPLNSTNGLRDIGDLLPGVVRPRDHGFSSKRDCAFRVGNKVLGSNGVKLERTSRAGTTAQK